MLYANANCDEALWERGNVFILAVPFFHILGLAMFCNQCMWHGNTTVILRKFDLPNLLYNIQTHRVTHINVVPPIGLLLAKSDLVDTHDLSSIRCIMNAAAPLKEPIMKLLSSRFKCPVTQWYGLTEAAPAVATQRQDEVHIPGTVGKLMPNMEAQIIDDEGEPTQYGKVGELAIRGPNVMKEYLQNPEATGHTIDANGFLRTGDAAYMKNNGYLYLVDRLKDMIKYKGYQIAPAELEAVLQTHPAVHEAAVSRIWSEENQTELPVGFITLSSNTESVNERERIVQSISSFFDEKVAHYKRLRGGIFVLDSIPKR